MNPLIRIRPDGRRVVELDPARRVLFLFEDPAEIRAQLEGRADFRMADVDPSTLLDDINTDVMTPAWVCFRHRPEDLALDAYAGLVDADVVDEPESGVLRYSLHAHKSMQLTVPDMQDLSRRLTDQATELGGRYDGWSAKEVPRTDGPAV